MSTKGSDNDASDVMKDLSDEQADNSTTDVLEKIDSATGGVIDAAQSGGNDTETNQRDTEEIENTDETKEQSQQPWDACCGSLEPYKKLWGQ